MTVNVSLPFRLHSFHRIAWVSDEARDAWQPSFQQVRGARQCAERRSVANHLRKCALQTIRSADRDGARRHAAELGLQFEALPSSPLVSPEMVRPVLIATRNNAAAFRQAWHEADFERVSELLGIPRCCSDAYARKVLDEQLTDATWPMSAVDAADGDKLDRRLAVGGHALLRRLGICLLPYIPCSAGCLASAQLAGSFRDVWKSHGLEEELKLLDEIFGWPVDWSELHGIAEVKLPVCRWIYDTDSTADGRRLYVDGTSHPAEAADGLRFPYSIPRKTKLTDSYGFQSGLAHADGCQPPSRIDPLQLAAQAGRNNARDINWSRVVQPQNDGYDSKVTLGLRRKRLRHLSEESELRPPAGGNPTLFGGRVVIRHVSPTCRFEKRLVNAPLEHVNIVRAVDCLRHWPDAFERFPQFVHTFNPLVDPTLPASAWRPGHGSISHWEEHGWGVIHATINDPFGLAQAFVREMAHLKLFALGVHPAWADRLVTNSPDERFEIPDTSRQRQPMTAVLHNVYSLAHVIELDLQVLDNTVDEQGRPHWLCLLKRNLEALRPAIACIVRHITTDVAGRQFVAALTRWVEDLIKRCGAVIQVA